MKEKGIPQKTDIASARLIWNNRVTTLNGRWLTVFGLTISSLSLAWSSRNRVIFDYEEQNGLTVRP